MAPCRAYPLHCVGWLVPRPYFDLVLISCRRNPQRIGDRAQPARARSFAHISKGAVDQMSGDMTLTCRDCGQGFTFTAGEQDFYASRGFSEPMRCPDCRAARRAERDRGSYSTGGGGGGGGGYEASSAPRGPRQMFEAVCSSCGSIASVP